MVMLARLSLSSEVLLTVHHQYAQKEYYSLKGLEMQRHRLAYDPTQYNKKRSNKKGNLHTCSKCQ